jgi:hypothetical protein
MAGQERVQYSMTGSVPIWSKGGCVTRVELPEETHFFEYGHQWIT